MLYSEIHLIFSDDYKGDVDMFDKIMSQSFLIADYISKTLFSYTPAKPKDKNNTRACNI